MPNRSSDSDLLGPRDTSFACAVLWLPSPDQEQTAPGRLLGTCRKGRWPGMPLGGVCMGAGESHLAEASACLAPSLSPSGAELPRTAEGAGQDPARLARSTFQVSYCIPRAGKVTQLVVTLAATHSCSEARKRGGPLSHPHRAHSCSALPAFVSRGSWSFDPGGPRPFAGLWGPNGCPQLSEAGTQPLPALPLTVLTLRGRERGHSCVLPGELEDHSCPTWRRCSQPTGDSLLPCHLGEANSFPRRFQVYSGDRNGTQTNSWPLF